MKQSNVEFFKDIIPQIFLETLDLVLKHEVKNSHIQTHYDITGIICIIGEKPINIAFQISETTANNIASIHENTGKNCDHIFDCIREMLLKIGFAILDRLHNPELVLSNPEVVSGKNHDLYFSKYQNMFELLFTSEKGNILFTVAYA